MNILVCKVFGIGNAIMSLPMIKALRLAHPSARIDVLIGDTRDDIGAKVIFSDSEHIGLINNLFVGLTTLRITYDVAIMSIPYDGRWKNGVHFMAHKVMDERPRPDPSTFGFSSWKKHEVEYQMENVYSLGYSGSIPDTLFKQRDIMDTLMNAVYIGIGYKKDEAGLWKVKHWGNENYAKLIKMLLDWDKDLSIFMTGNSDDFIQTIVPILKLVGKNDRFSGLMTSLELSIKLMSRCHTYIGNDTGMMHVAASMDKKVIGLFFMENVITKNRPWCDDFVAVDGFNNKITVERLFETVDHVMYVLGD